MKWRWVVLQTFRGGHTEEVASCSTKAEAEERMVRIIDAHAAVYGYGQAEVKRRAVKRTKR